MLSTWITRKLKILIEYLFCAKNSKTFINLLLKRKLLLGPYVSPFDAYQDQQSFSLGKDSCGSSSLETGKRPHPHLPAKE